MKNVEKIQRYMYHYLFFILYLGGRKYFTPEIILPASLVAAQIPVLQKAGNTFVNNGIYIIVNYKNFKQESHATKN